MIRERLAVLAWAIVALGVFLAGAESVFEVINDPQALSDALVRPLVLLVFMGVGMLIVARESRNRIGWLFCIAALLLASGMCAIEFAVYILRTLPGAPSSGIWLALYGSWARDAGFFAVLTFLPLIFPTGRLVSPRWRLAARLVIGTHAAYFAA